MRRANIQIKEIIPRRERQSSELVDVVDLITLFLVCDERQQTPRIYILKMNQTRKIWTNRIWFRLDPRADIQLEKFERWSSIGPSRDNYDKPGIHGPTLMPLIFVFIPLFLFLNMILKDEFINVVQISTWVKHDFIVY